MTADDRVDAAVIAHDLRNLLQITASALLQIDRHLDGATRARVRLYEHAASESLARAGALSRALVDGARGTASADAEAICPGEALSAIRHLIELAAGPAVRVGFALADDVPPVACSVRDLERALLNLVANARDAMPEGGTLVLSIARERRTAVLRVRDTGRGMSADTAAQVFDPFFTTKAACGGRGLGLAMVKRFAERAGGSAQIDSALGVGTTVTLRLPGARRSC